MRANKAVSLIVLSAFLLFEWSCATLRRSGEDVTGMVPKETPVGLANVKAKIVAVTTKEGKKISFPENAPGRFDESGQAVVGVALQQFVFVKNDVVIARDDKKGIVRSVTTVDGRFYEVLSSLDEGDNIRVNAYAPISIPRSDILYVSVLKHSWGGNVFGAILGIAALAAVGYLGYIGIIKPLLDISKDPKIR